MLALHGRRSSSFRPWMPALAVLGACSLPPQGAEPRMHAAMGDVDRTAVPTQEPTYAPITTLDARDAKAPSRFEIEAPEGAPNVVIVLIDDIGFGHSSA